MVVVRGIHHVTLAVPEDRVDATISFYRDVLGLTVRPAPEFLLSRNIVAWIDVGADEIHLAVESEPRNDASRRHFCIRVDDLGAARQALEAAGVAIEVATPIPGRPRFFVRDPAAN